MIYENPEFIDYNTWNFNLEESSPCIDSGSPDIIDQDGTISDIGATKIDLNCSNLGDLNNDNLINVLDITLGVCSILNTTNNNCVASCNWDMNNDNEYNIVDIILIINIIIN